MERVPSNDMVPLRRAPIHQCRQFPAFHTLPIKNVRLIIPFVHTKAQRMTFARDGRLFVHFLWNATFMSS
jgi:hypothetical protein